MVATKVGVVVRSYVTISIRSRSLRNLWKGDYIFSRLHQWIIQYCDVAVVVRWWRFGDQCVCTCLGWALGEWGCESPLFLLTHGITGGLKIALNYTIHGYDWDKLGVFPLKIDPTLPTNGIIALGMDSPYYFTSNASECTTRFVPIWKYVRRRRYLVSWFLCRLIERTTLHCELHGGM